MAGCCGRCSRQPHGAWKHLRHTAQVLEACKKLARAIGASIACYERARNSRLLRFAPFCDQRNFDKDLGSDRLPPQLADSVIQALSDRNGFRISIRSKLAGHRFPLVRFSQALGESPLPSPHSSVPQPSVPRSSMSGCPTAAFPTATAG